MKRAARALLPLLALALWAFFIAQTGRWPSGDGPHVLGAAARLDQLLRDGEVLTFGWCFQSLLGPHPPGAYVPALLANMALGAGRWTHLAAGAGVLWLCWDGMRRLGGGPVSALLLAMAAPVWLQAENYGVDLLAAAAVVQCVSHLVASEGLSDRPHTLAWGAWLGVAFMTKYTAPMFLWAPCLAVGVSVLRHGRWRALGAAVLAFSVVAMPWWLSHLGGVVGYLGASTDASMELATNEDMVTSPWTALENLSWYPAALVDAVGWPGLGALVVGLALPRKLEGRWLLPLLAGLGGWLILAMQVQRQDRYLLPLLPLLAAVAGGSRLRWLLAPVGAIGTYGAAAVFLTWTDVPPSRDYTHALDGAGQAWPWVHDAYAPTSLDPSVWQLDEALAELRELQGSDEGTVGFLLDETDGAPNFGLVLSRVGVLGYRWHVATVMPLAKPDGSVDGAVFVGPFTTDDWPSRDFRVLLAILRKQDPLRERWLQESGMKLVDSWELPKDREGRLYVMEDGWVTLGR